MLHRQMSWAATRPRIPASNHSPTKLVSQAQSSVRIAKAGHCRACKQSLLLGVSLPPFLSTARSTHHPTASTDRSVRHAGPVLLVRLRRWKRLDAAEQTLRAFVSTYCLSNRGRGHRRHQDLHHHCLHLLHHLLRHRPQNQPVRIAAAHCETAVAHPLCGAI